MKLSARNLLPGKILEITKGQMTAHVRIAISQGVFAFQALQVDPA